MAAFNVTTAAGNLPGALQPEYGLLGGLAEGFRSAIGGYRQAKMDQADLQTKALQNQMINKAYQLKLFESGLQEDPNYDGDPSNGSPFKMDPNALKRAQYQMELSNRQKAFDAARTVNEKLLEDGRPAVDPGTLTPYLAPPGTNQTSLQMGSNSAPAPGTQAAGMQGSSPSGATPDSTLAAAPADQPAAATTPPAQGMIQKPVAGLVPKGLVAKAQPLPPFQTPGGLSPALAKTKEEFIKLQRENQDALPGLGKTDQENVGDLRKQAVADRQTLINLQPLIEQIKDPSLSASERKLAGNRAVKILNDGNLRGGKPYEDLTELLQKVRTEEPYFGPQFNLFAKQLDAEAGKLKGTYDTNNKTISGLLGGKYKGMGDIPESTSTKAMAKYDPSKPLPAELKNDPASMKARYDFLKKKAMSVGGNE